MSTAAFNLPYTPQLDSGAIRSFVFAVMVHGALFGFLYLGVRWQCGPQFGFNRCRRLTLPAHTEIQKPEQSSVHHHRKHK